MPGVTNLSVVARETEEGNKFPGWLLKVRYTLRRQRFVQLMNSSPTGSPENKCSALASTDDQEEGSLNWPVSPNTIIQKKIDPAFRGKRWIQGDFVKGI